MIIDKLFESVAAKGPVCVGLDTSMDYIPEGFLKKYIFWEDALYRFNQRIIDSTFDVSACFKVQIAYYESYGLKGLQVYKKTLDYIKSIGGIVIADIKRGDIAKTAEMYAKAHFEGDFESDFVTLNPYMGMDSIEPYLPYLESKEKGIFALVRTSNKGAEDIEYIESKSGKRVYNIVGNKLYEMGIKYAGKYGYSSIGGVVGCTHVEEAIELRRELNNMFFLIPGYGAQGGKAEDVALYMRDGNGGIVNSSRAVLMAHKNHYDAAGNFDIYSRDEVINMKEAIQKALEK